MELSLLVLLEVGKGWEWLWSRQLSVSTIAINRNVAGNKNKTKIFHLSSKKNF